MKCSVDGCLKSGRFIKGYCHMHWQRLYRTGSINISSALRGSLHEFVDSAVMYAGEDCLTWPFGKDRKGYGIISVDRKMRLAHRIVCERVNGSPPSPKHEAAHSCGNGHLGCVAPKHLRWATRKENAEDSVAHGTIVKGSKQGRSKLTADDVIRIRALAESSPRKEIANTFGISRNYVNDILRGVTWNWLSEERI